MNDIAYDGPERRWSNETPGRARFSLWAVAAALFLLVMLPLGYLVWSSRRADLRAERAGHSVCVLAHTTDNLAVTLNAGVAVLVTDDPAQRAKLIQELRQVTAQAQNVQRLTGAQCGLGSSTLPP